MRFLPLLCLMLLFSGCSKYEFDPMNPKNGQEVELTLEHYFTVTNPMIGYNGRSFPYTYIADFNERELGYTYRIRAKVVLAPERLMDAPPYWFSYVKTLSKKRYEGNETFDLEIIGYFGAGPLNALSKENNDFYYMGTLLIIDDEAIKNQLDQILVELKEHLDAGTASFRQVTLTAKHDPDNWGKAFLVHGVEIVE